MTKHSLLWVGSAVSLVLLLASLVGAQDDFVMNTNRLIPNYHIFKLRDVALTFTHTATSTAVTSPNPFNDLTSEDPSTRQLEFGTEVHALAMGKNMFPFRGRSDYDDLVLQLPNNATLDGMYLYRSFSWIWQLANNERLPNLELDVFDPNETLMTAMYGENSTITSGPLGPDGYDFADFVADMNTVLATRTLRTVPYETILQGLAVQQETFAVAVVGGVVRDVLARKNLSEINDIDVTSNQGYVALSFRLNDMLTGLGVPVGNSIKDQLGSMRRQFGMIKVSPSGEEVDGMDIGPLKVGYAGDDKIPNPVQTTLRAAQGHFYQKYLFGLSYERDAELRDYTFNAIYYEPLTQRLVDPLGGIADSLSKTVRIANEREYDRDAGAHWRFWKFVVDKYNYTESLGKDSNVASKACGSRAVALFKVFHTAGKQTSLPQIDAFFRKMRQKLFKEEMPLNEYSARMQAIYNQFVRVINKEADTPANYVSDHCSILFNNLVNAVQWNSDTLIGKSPQQLTQWYYWNLAGTDGARTRKMIEVMQTFKDKKFAGVSNSNTYDIAAATADNGMRKRRIIPRTVVPLASSQLKVAQDLTTYLGFVYFKLATTLDTFFETPDFDDMDDGFPSDLTLQADMRIVLNGKSHLTHRILFGLVDMSLVPSLSAIPTMAAPIQSLSEGTEGSTIYTIFVNSANTVTQLVSVLSTYYTGGAATKMFGENIATLRNGTASIETSQIAGNLTDVGFYAIPYTVKAHSLVLAARVNVASYSIFGLDSPPSRLTFIGPLTSWNYSVALPSEAIELFLDVVYTGEESARFAGANEMSVIVAREMIQLARLGTNTFITTTASIDVPLVVGLSVGLGGGLVIVAGVVVAVLYFMRKGFFKPPISV